MKFRIYHILAAAALFTLAACNDKDEWTPGPADDAAGTRAYFPAVSKSSYEFDVEADPDEMKIDVTVSRSLTEDAVTVPLTLSSDEEGFSLSGNAVFAAGQESVVVTLDCSGIPEGKDVNVKISLPDDQYYTYGEGMPAAEFTVLKARWIEISDNVSYYYQTDSGATIYPNTEGKMYQLDGNMRFKLTDFFGSGLDMRFNCDKPEGMQMIPLENADYENVLYEEDKDDKGWLLYDEENQTWPTWTPGNVSGYPAISYLTFYDVSDYNGLEMVYNPETLYGYMWFITYVLYDNNTGTWGYFQADFNLKYNPFAK